MKKIVFMALLLIAGALFLIISIDTQKDNGKLQLAEQKHLKKSGPKYDRPDQAMLEEVYLRSEIDKPFSYPANWKMQALNHAKSDMRLAKTAALTWQEKGPGNVGGRTRAIVVHPQNATIWWVGAVGGGIWKTTDSGSSWACQTDDLPVLSVTTLDICQNQPDVLYAGTGEGGFYNYDAIVGDGIFKTTDGGASWNQLSATATNFDFRSVNRLVVHPLNPDTVLVASKSGVFRSYDGGTIWETVFQNGGNVQQIIANNERFSSLFITVNGYGIYKSTDLGQTWQKVSADIIDPSRIEMAMAQNDTSVLYATVVNGSGGLSAFYRSNDAGLSWTSFISGSEDNNWLGAQGWYDNTLTVHPFNLNIVFVGGIDLYRVDASQNPATLSQISHWYGGEGLPYVHADQHSIVPLPSDNMTDFGLIAANDGGVHYSSDQGQNWTSKNNHYNVTQFYDADKNPVYRQYIGGTQDNGTNLSVINPDFSSRWEEVVGGDGFDCAWHKQDENIVFATLYDSRIFRSKSGGEGFIEVNNGLPRSSIFHTPLTMDPHNSSKLFTISGSDSIFYTTDAGDSWQGVDCDFGGSRWVKITVSQKDSNVVWAAGNSERINISTDAGKSFTTLTRPAGTPYARLTGLATSPQDSASALALFGVYGYGKVFRTTDLGASWTDITTNLPDIPVHTALIMPYDSSEIWLGTDIGLFISNDEGQSWNYANHNLPAVSIRRLKIIGKEIVAATHGRGIWSVINDKLDTQPIAVKEPTLSPLNSPDPNTNNLRIDFTPRGDYDSLQVLVNKISIETITQFTAYRDTFIIYHAPVPAEFGINIRGYKDMDIYNSEIRTIQTYAAIDSLREHFDSGPGLFNGDFTIFQEEGFNSTALHSTHPYGDKLELTAQIGAPIKIVDGLRFFYQDIALIEPGETNAWYPNPQMWDYVTSEYSLDGINWEILSNPYDARFDPDWLAYYQTESTPIPELWRNHQHILSETLPVGQNAYIRFRLYADEYTNGWGWTIDNVYVGMNDITDIEDPLTILNDFSLNQNYPNPFNPSTVITYQIPVKGHIELSVYNALGQKVRTLIDKVENAGSHQVTFDAQTLASGIYYYRLQSGLKTETRKMILIK